MSRSPRSRIEDIIVACDAISDYLDVDGIDEGILFDAVRIRLIEIGEAAKDLPASVTSGEREVPWNDLSRMRDHLAHRYFDASHAIVLSTARHDVPVLAAAARRMLVRIDTGDTWKD